MPIIYPQPFRQHYVYVYHDPRKPDCPPYYVGGGCGDTVMDHLTGRRKLKDNPHKYYTTRAIKEAGLTPPIRIVWYGDSEEERDRTEVEYILKYGRIDLGTGPLTNLTAGGDGGGVPGPETRARESQAAKTRFERDDGKAHIENLKRINAIPEVAERRKQGRSQQARSPNGVAQQRAAMEAARTPKGRGNTVLAWNKRKRTDEWLEQQRRMVAASLEPVSQAKHHKSQKIWVDGESGQAHMRQMSAAHTAVWFVVLPNEQSQGVYNLNRFCQGNSLHTGHLSGGYYRGHFSLNLGKTGSEVLRSLRCLLAVLNVYAGAHDIETSAANLSKDFRKPL